MTHQLHETWLHARRNPRQPNVNQALAHCSSSGHMFSQVGKTLRTEAEKAEKELKSYQRRTDVPRFLLRSYLSWHLYSASLGYVTFIMHALDFASSQIPFLPWQILRPVIAIPLFMLILSALLMPLRTFWWIFITGNIGGVITAYLDPVPIWPKVMMVTRLVLGIEPGHVLDTWFVANLLMIIVSVSIQLTFFFFLKLSISRILRRNSLMETQIISRIETVLSALWQFLLEKIAAILEWFSEMHSRMLKEQVPSILEWYVIGGSVGGIPSLTEAHRLGLISVRLSQLQDTAVGRFYPLTA
jgi:hypothetical protein